MNNIIKIPTTVMKGFVAIISGWVSQKNTKDGKVIDNPLIKETIEHLLSESVDMSVTCTESEALIINTFFVSLMQFIMKFERLQTDKVLELDQTPNCVHIHAGDLTMTFENERVIGSAIRFSDFTETDNTFLSTISESSALYTYEQEDTTGGVITKSSTTTTLPFNASED